MHEFGPGSPEPADEILAQRVQRGDRAALEQLAGRYLRPIHAVTASYLAEPVDIEDAVQETFVRALTAIASYDASRRFAPWLYQIARNVARDRLAANARHNTEPLPADGPEEPSAAADTVLERAEIRQLVNRGIARLPEQQRTAFRLHDVEGYTTAEIAHIMGLSAGTVRSHVHHARRTLRVALACCLGEQAGSGG